MDHVVADTPAAFREDDELADRHPAAAPPPRPHRADIDGLRAVSILLVVGYHAGLSWLPGGFVGVDVFFVLSGFLITGLLLAELAATDRIALGQFFARRARRLLPLSTLVLVATLLAGMVLLPPLARAGLVRDARAAALYVANWRFAGQATAYSDAEVTDSLLVHYWSLSIEEQFYALWPALIIAVAWFAGRRAPRRRQLHALLSVAIGVVVVVSLAASWRSTSRLGPEAYFVTHTRLWELGVGAGLALAVPLARRLPRLAADVLAGAGLAAVVYAAARFGAGTAFPGRAALVPVLGCAAVVIAAAHRQTVVSRVLGSRPLPLLGRLSYAWYLWHWPAIGIALLWNDRHGAPFSAGVVTAVAVVASLGLAAASHVVVEQPLRYAALLRDAPWRSLVLGLALSSLPILLGIGALRVVDGGDIAVATPVVAEGVVAEGVVAEQAVAPMTPAQARDDIVTVGPVERCSAQLADVAVPPDCVYGDPAGSVTVAVVGDSHAQQWLPALDAAGTENGWRVLGWTKSACTMFDVTLWSKRLERRYDECDTWRASVLDQLRRAAPIDLLVMTNTYSYRDVLDDGNGHRLEDPARADVLWQQAAQRSFAELLGVARKVVRLEDTPWPTDDVPTCLSAQPGSPSACGFDTAARSNLDRELIALEAAVAPDGVRFLDLGADVCPAQWCEVVDERGVIVFRDQHHLTQTFSRSLAGVVGGELASLLPDG